MFCFRHALLALIFVSANFIAPFFVCAASDETGASIRSVSVGIGGYYKSGFTTPVAVRYKGLPAGKELMLELGSFDSDKTPTVSRFAFTPDSDEGTVNGVFASGKAAEPLTVRFLDPESGETLDERIIFPGKRSAKNIESSEKDIFYPPEVFSHPAWLLVGAAASSDELNPPADSGLNALITELRLDEPFRPQVHTLSAFCDLPLSADGYDAVDLVFLTGNNPTFFDGVGADDPRIAALAEWVKRGGRLIVAGGSESLPLFKEGGALSRLIPGHTAAESPREIRIANALVQYVPKAKNLVMTGTLDNPYLRVPLLEPDADATVDLFEMETPMLIRRPFGFGTLTWFAADPASSPLAGWSGRTGLLLRVFGYDAEKIAQTQTDTALVQLGYDDLSGQMRSALDRFTGVRHFPFSLVLSLIFLYILVIGPLDWFLTHRVFKRPNLTWLTLPLWLLLFSVGALWLGGKIQPGEVRGNRVELIDLDTASQTVRGTGWTGFFSPADRRYNLTLAPNFSGSISSAGKPDISLGWLGLDGEGLGGMASKTISPTSWSEPYSILPHEGRLNDFPVQVRSSRALLDRWFAPVKTETTPLEVKDSAVNGRLVNPLGVEISDAILFYNRMAYHVGTLPPEGMEIDKKIRRIDASRVLNGTVDPFNETLSNTMMQTGLARYDTMAADPAYILRTMMFYRLAGGEKAVGLSNARGTLLDATESLRAGRAVLIGTLRDDFAAAEANVPVEGPISADLLFQTAKNSEEQSDAGPSEGFAPRRARFVRVYIPVKNK